MVIVALSKSDGHIYQSNPASENNIEIVKDNIISDMVSCGLAENVDFDLEEMTDAEFNLLFYSVD